MIIVHLCNYYQSKLGYQEYFLANIHARMGHEVHVVTSDRYFPFPDYKNTVESILGDRFVGVFSMLEDGVNVHRLPVLFEYSARVWLIGLEKKMKSINPDLVICHGIFNFNTIRLSIIADLLKAKIIIDDHMLYSEIKKGISSKLAYSIFSSYFSPFIESKADMIVGVAEECIQYIKEYMKIDSDKLRMIPLGADEVLFQYNSTLGIELRQELDIDKEKCVIVYTGKLTEKKGPHLIIEALSTIEESLNNVAVLFVGNLDRNYSQKFERFVKQSPVPIFRLPAVKNSELCRIYNASDIAVWPQQGSMSMIEAMSCGLPIICIKNLTERYKNNNGLPIEEGNVKELSKALHTLISDKNLRMTMGKNSREFVEKELSWKKIAESFII